MKTDQRKELPRIYLKMDNPVNLIELLNGILKTESLPQAASELNLSPGTLKRWLELNNIPESYEFDILKLSGANIDYSKYSHKSKDQFFTQKETAKYCFGVFTKLINSDIDKYEFLEPSAGDGSFLNFLPKGTIAFDIEPRDPRIEKADFLNLDPKTIFKGGGKVPVVFGNPPFGLRGNLALKFINRALESADFVCFILPPLFESDGKGSPRKRVKGGNLIHSEKLEATFYYPPNNGEVPQPIKINTVFQIWSKYITNPHYEIKTVYDPRVKIYSMSDGGTISSTRNKNMIGKCNLYIPSTCFGKENMKCYKSFEDLPGRRGYGIVITDRKLLLSSNSINWGEVAFLSTNSAYNLRSSQIMQALLGGGSK